MEKYLLQIANTLVLYSYHIKNLGVINGKMGIAIFLFHYARFAKNDLYNDFADSIIDEILKARCHIPIDFENGLTGIAWGINYLIKKKFVDGNPDDVLQDIDAKISMQIEDQSTHFIFGQALYFLSRMNVENMDDKVEKLLVQCEKKITKYIANNSLYFLNSVLLFLLQVDKCKPLQNTDLKMIIQNLICITLDRKKYDDVDYQIFHDILNEYLSDDAGLVHLVYIKKNIILINNGTDIVDDFIKKAWLNMLYFENKKIDIPTQDSICTFVNRKQESLLEKDFLLNRGLAGLGLGLIRNL